MPKLRAIISAVSKNLIILNLITIIRLTTLDCQLMEVATNIPFEKILLAVMVEVVILNPPNRWMEHFR